MTDVSDDMKTLAEKYAELGTINKAAAAMGLNYSTARKRLKRMGVELNDRSWRSDVDILTGEECRRKRRELNLSQDDLMQLSGTTVATISLFENGRRRPQQTTQKKLAQALGLIEKDPS
ncbi:helix-turn-helix transcriptional regulator [Rhodobacteraceae bacterium G21628-S1]|nr:helix-turn-helix transcriptional regulator [Rhodobacteraceae bacterium G21628-S1]